ncbi:unnamed protein product, partial [Iphiclides podalirius]
MADLFLVLHWYPKKNHKGSNWGKGLTGGAEVGRYPEPFTRSFGRPDTPWTTRATARSSLALSSLRLTMEKAMRQTRAVHWGIIACTNFAGGDATRFFLSAIRASVTSIGWKVRGKVCARRTGELCHGDVCFSSARKEHASAEFSFGETCAERKVKVARRAS